MRTRRWHAALGEALWVRAQVMRPCLSLPSPPCPACQGSLTTLRRGHENGILVVRTIRGNIVRRCDVSSCKPSDTRVPLYGIERHADSMGQRPPGFAIVLVLTLWAFAGLVTLTCACCVLMGGTCPGVCASSPSVLATPSPQTSVSGHLVYLHPPSPPVSPVVPIPTPPPKARFVSA